MERKVNLEQLAEILNEEPEEKLTTLVLDNTARRCEIFIEEIQYPAKGENFLHIDIKREKIGLPLERGKEEAEELLKKHGVESTGKIVVFNHHDLEKAYAHIDGIDYYEFSHIEDCLSYLAMLFRDTKILSHMLNRSFYDIPSLTIVHSGIPEKRLRELQKEHWYFDLNEYIEKKAKKQGVDLESMIIYMAASLFGPKNIVPDPRREREEHKTIKIPVDQYAISSLFPRASCITRYPELDKKVSIQLALGTSNWDKIVELAEEITMVPDLRSLGEYFYDKLRRYISEETPEEAVNKITEAFRRLGSEGETYARDLIKKYNYYRNR